MFSTAGIDFSLRSPAMCILKHNSKEMMVDLFFVKQRAKPYPTKLIEFCNQANQKVTIALHPYNACKTNGFAKQVWAANTVAGWVSASAPDKVVLEGYAYSKHFGNQTMMEAGGMLKMALYVKGFEVVTVTPTKAKKVLTGNGKATKKDMLDCLRSQYGIDLLTILDQTLSKDLHPAEDLADAFALCLAHSHVNGPKNA